MSVPVHITIMGSSADDNGWYEHNDNNNNGNIDTMSGYATASMWSISLGNITVSDNTSAAENYDNGMYVSNYFLRKIKGCRVWVPKK